MWRGACACACALAALLAALAGVAHAEPEPHCPAVPGANCTLSDPSTVGDYEATVDGAKVWLQYSAPHFLRLKCAAGTPLDHAALPRFKEKQEIRSVRLQDCAPPARGSYADALAALGVELPDDPALVLNRSSLHVMGKRPELLPAEPRHLLGLERLLRLTLEQTGGGRPAELPASLFEGRLRALRGLRLVRVALGAGAALALPPSLLELHLVGTGLSALPADALRRLPAFNTLVVDESGEGGVRVAPAGAPRLRVLTLRARRGLLFLEGPLPPHLERLELHWKRRDAPPPPPSWPGGCPLRQLTLIAGAGEKGHEVRLELGPWLSGCRRLEELVVHAPLAALSDAVFAGLNALRSLTLSGCSLSALPPHLLGAAGNLSRVDLSNNQLDELPAQLLAGVRVNWLDLSHNRLPAAAAEAVGKLAAVLKLDLHDNPLGDLCIGGGSSPTVWADANSYLRELKTLRYLDLRNTGVTRICRDWRQTMEELEHLNLDNTAITQLTFSELQYRRKARASVYLRGIPLENVQYSYEDYNATGEAGAGSARVTVLLDASLRCDCRQYWAARAFRYFDTGVRLQNLTCGAHPFDEVSLDLLACDAPELCPALPEGCGCRSRPDPRPPGLLVRLACENASLDSVPSVNRSRRFAWALHLAANRIGRVRAADLPPVLEEVDLSHNPIERLDPATVAALLGSRDARLSIAGDRLECGCSEREALEALRAAGPRVDFADAECVDGGPLRVPEPCRTWEWVAAAVVVAGILMGAGVALSLARPAGRLWFKAALVRLGWEPRGAAGEGNGVRFDAFVSYAHQDEAVARALTARLERGRTPLRLCVHERDWAPGGWIPAQIAASVRASRCTVALLSEHYVRSGWACAEFREARAAALRDAHTLIVVPLAPPESLALDAELRAHLADNTYVRWGDPWFWEKLRVAMRAPDAGRTGRGARAGFGGCLTWPTRPPEKGSALSAPACPRPPTGTEA